MSPWIQYTLLRLGLFGVTFGVLMAIQLDWWWAAIVASIIAMTVSYIFFGTLRDAVALDLAARREKPAADPDAEAEDAAADPSSSSPSSPTP
ncbi:DUF4229 domain-containing protein [Microcella frigidaquae]|uniref:DUF4229 domain-containing protein n=1 Tax=Microcella frigidaquae TaxID=424758 RepID=A0A840XAV1_9MICO|nr:hypothetical protein [Microcella frigidaquae]NHN44790.1 DUF4229 domain-containing protein [Microcella frigidaquae]